MDWETSDTSRPGLASAPLPQGLAAFCRAAVGEVAAVGFCGWPHAESAVWRVRAQTGARLYLKVHRQPQKFIQERAAYRAWTAALEPYAPRLVADDEALGALLVTAVPGTLLERAPLGDAETGEAHRQAGALLARLHTLPYRDDDPIPLAEAVTRRLAAWLARARGVVDPAQAAWVAARVAEALPMLRGERRVPCHRDYTPRNWLWHAGALYVIDFEHARGDLWFMDLERLWRGPWRRDPALREAFLAGYGRALGAEEEGVLARLAALGALSTIIWARRHGDAPFEAEGREALAWLQARG